VKFISLSSISAVCLLVASVLYTSCSSDPYYGPGYGGGYGPGYGSGGAYYSTSYYRTNRYYDSGAYYRNRPYYGNPGYRPGYNRPVEQRPSTDYTNRPQQRPQNQPPLRPAALRPQNQPKPGYNAPRSVINQPSESDERRRPR
jgi:hypothetical protein